MKNKILAFAIGLGLFALLGAGTIEKIAQQNSISIRQTNFTSELIVSNGATLGGVRRTSWPAGQPASSVLTNLANGDGSDLTNVQASGNYITALTGDGTASGPGSVALTLASVATAGTYGNTSYFPIITIDAKGRVTTVSTQQVAGGITGLANPTATIGISAVNGSATTAMRSDAAPPLPTKLTAQEAFESYQGSLTHAGSVGLDFSAATRVCSMTVTGNLTFTFSNLATNRTWRVLLLNAQASNCTLSLPAGTKGYYTATLSNGWHMLTAESWGTVASNVWVSTSSEGTY